MGIVSVRGSLRATLAGGGKACPAFVDFKNLHGLEDSES